MFRLVPALSVVFGLLAVGCRKNAGGDGTADAPPAVTPGAENWVKLGPVGMSVESVRVGKVRMGGMMGRAAESKDDVFQVRTRFRLFDPAAVVKQGTFQSDGMVMFGHGLALKGADGTAYKEVGGGGFDSIKGRRTKAVELTAAAPEATDLLTFEGTAGLAEELVLTVPGTWQEKQPDGTFLRPPTPGAFTFRIPKAAWSAPPRAVEAGPGNWYRIGPVGAEVRAARVGKVPLESRFGKGHSTDDVLAVTVAFRVFDPKAAVKKSPFMPDGGFGFNNPAVVLAGKNGERFPAVLGGTFDRVAGRQAHDAELWGKTPEVTDLLTFDAKAATADELFLTLWPNWSEKAADGKWADPDTDDEFRFRLPRALWAK